MRKACLGFTPRYSVEAMLIAVVNDLQLSQNRGGTFILTFLDFFQFCQQVSFWANYGGWGWEALCCSYSIPQCSVPGCVDGRDYAQGCTLVGAPGFNIQMKPLGEVIHQFMIQYHQHSDITEIDIGAGFAREAVELMTQCLEVWIGTNFNLSGCCHRSLRDLHHWS